jgi:hypothetical protein
MRRSRVVAGLERVRAQDKRLGRPMVPPKVENTNQNASEGTGGVRLRHRSAGEV